MLVMVSVVPSMLFCVYAFYQQVVNGIQVGDSSAPNAFLIVIFVVLCVILWSVFVMKLEVWVDETGIHFRFFPLIFKPKVILKNEIQRFEIRKYSPIFDYGGLGIKRRFKWGRAYNVSGNIGLQIYLTNGKKVLFGTQRSQAIQYAMDTMMNNEITQRKH
ncbi:MAG TPA: hypothetical protein DHV48_14565 [Prolixibacteraceae bacterium]|nr:hypothetical protein [Prolixibacteraceae bacterium]